MKRAWCNATLNQKGELIEKRFLRSRRLSINAVSIIEVRRIPSLYDELGLMLYSHVDAFCVRETDKSFQQLKSQFQLDKLLGSDWYQRAEAGEILRANVNQTK